MNKYEEGFDYRKEMDISINTYDNGFIKGYSIGRKLSDEEIKEIYKEGFERGFNRMSNHSNKMIKKAYDDGFKEGGGEII